MHHIYIYIYILCSYISHDILTIYMIYTTTYVTIHNLIQYRYMLYYDTYNIYCMCIIIFLIYIIDSMCNSYALSLLHVGIYTYICIYIYIYTGCPRVYSLFECPLLRYILFLFLVQTTLNNGKYYQQLQVISLNLSHQTRSSGNIHLNRKQIHEQWPFIE